MSEDTISLEEALGRAENFAGRKPKNPNIRGFSLYVNKEKNPTGFEFLDSFIQRTGSTTEARNIAYKLVQAWVKVQEANEEGESEGE